MFHASQCDHCPENLLSSVLLLCIAVAALAATLYLHKSRLVGGCVKSADLLVDLLNQQAALHNILLEEVLNLRGPQSAIA